MSGTEFERPPAKSIETLDLHLLYVQRQLAKLVDAMPQMATKADIAALAQRLEGYATKDELRTLQREVTLLKVDVTSGSVQSTFDRWATVAAKLTAICAFLGAAALAIAHLVEKLK